MLTIDITPKELSPIEEIELPRWKPRKATRRTIIQWWYYILYRLGYYKSEGTCYGCDVCGASTDDDYPSSTLLDITDYSYDYWASCEFGGTQYTWSEEHQCNRCGTQFGFHNGSC